jgi:hypothetical protein
MPYSVEYFNERVLAEIERWPVGVLPDYARLVELLVEFGPDLRMPHTRALGSGLFGLRLRGREGMGRHCTATSSVSAWSCSTPSSRRRRRPLSKIWRSLAAA